MVSPKTDPRFPNNEFRILNDCNSIFHAIIKITQDNQQYRYTLNQHIVRTVVSVGSNIAESNSRKGKDKIRFLTIAEGSIEELKFQLSLYSVPIELYDNVFDLIDKIKATVYKLKKSELGGRK